MNTLLYLLGGVLLLAALGLLRLNWIMSPKKKKPFCSYCGETLTGPLEEGCPKCGKPVKK